MKIAKAQYVADENGNNTSILITHDLTDDNPDGEQCSCPIDGSTWVNAELNDWVDGGGKIAAAVPIKTG